jgi:hypothetical protein
MEVNLHAPPLKYSLSLFLAKNSPLLRPRHPQRKKLDINVEQKVHGKVEKGTPEYESILAFLNFTLNPSPIKVINT